MTNRVSPSDTVIKKAIIRLATARGTAKTICPSEVARNLAGSDPTQWRPLMPLVKEAAVVLAKSRKIAIKQSGRIVDSDSIAGIYRIAILKD